jgi:hypothetical protein
MLPASRSSGGDEHAPEATSSSLWDRDVVAGGRERPYQPPARPTLHGQLQAQITQAACMAAHRRAERLEAALLPATAWPTYLTARFGHA